MRIEMIIIGERGEGKTQFARLFEQFVMSLHSDMKLKLQEVKVRSESGDGATGTPEFHLKRVPTTELIRQPVR